MQSLCYNNHEWFNMRQNSKKILQIFGIAAGLILTACTNRQKDGDFMELTRDPNYTELNKKLIEQEMKIQRLEEKRAEKQKKAKLLTKIRQDNPFDEKAKSDKNKKVHNCFAVDITNMKSYREALESKKHEMEEAMKRREEFRKREAEFRQYLRDHVYKIDPRKHPEEYYNYSF